MSSFCKANDQQFVFAIRVAAIGALIVLAIIIGSGSYLTVRNLEEISFKSTCQDLSEHLKRYVDSRMTTIADAQGIMNDLQQSWKRDGNIGSYPNVVIPAFDAIMTRVAKNAEIRTISFSPLVTSKNLSSFEEYAKSNVDLLGGPNELKVRASGCESSSCQWIVSDGVFSISNGLKQPVPKSIPDSEYPDVHFPVWQIAPIASNYKVIMLDNHATPGTRKVTGDKVLRTKQGAFTDLFELSQDTKPRASAVYYAPITSDKPGNPIIGLFGGAFSFDDLFRNAISKNIQHIHCVVTSEWNTQYTLSVENGVVNVVGKGDFHDTKYNSYRQSINVIGNFQIDIYPGNSFALSQLSSKPLIASLTAVGAVIVAAIVCWIYMVTEMRLKKQLQEQSDANFVLAAESQDAMMQQKKVYVRYISHEVKNLYLFLEFN